MALCGVCKGAQNLVSFTHGIEYFDCPACLKWGFRDGKNEIKEEYKELEKLV